AKSVRHGDVSRRRTEARRVGQVEGFEPELAASRPADADALRQRGVEVLETRGPRDADAAVAPRAAGRAGEGVDVQPLIECLSRRRRVADAVRPFVAARGLKRRTAAVGDRDRETGSCLEIAAEPPTANQGIRRGGAAPPERQLIARRKDEVVADVEE